MVSRTTFTTTHRKDALAEVETAPPEDITPRSKALVWEGRLGGRASPGRHLRAQRRALTTLLAIRVGGEGDLHVSVSAKHAFGICRLGARRTMTCFLAFGGLRLGRPYLYRTQCRQAAHGTRTAAIGRTHELFIGGFRRSVGQR